MANSLITPTMVLKEAGRSYVNNVQFIKNIRQYDNQYRFNGAKVGNTVQYRLPNMFTVADGQALQLQPLMDRTVPVSLTHQKHIDLGWSTAQGTTEIEEIKARYTDPAGKTLGAVADAFAFNAVYKDVYNAVGTPGTTPSTTLTWLQAGVKLGDNGAPGMSERIAVVDAMANATLANTTSALFNPSAGVSGNYRNGVVGSNQLGIAEWYTDSNRPTHTTGSFTASTPLTNGAGQTGSTLNTDGWASGATTLRKGDVFTIAGVYGVNQYSKASTARLQQFVVTADTSDSSGAIAALPISPSIITSGPLQNVSASPANDAAITVWSANPAGGTLAATASPVSMLFTPDAFAFVTADLEKPNGGAETARIRGNGIAMRMVEQYDVRTDQNITRIDILIGAATIRPEWAVRVQG